MTADLTPTEALATAFVSALCGGSPDCENMADHQNDAHAIYAALPPGWRLVGPDAVVVNEAMVERAARHLARDEGFGGSSEGEGWWQHLIDRESAWVADYRAKARRLLGEDG